MKQWLRFIFSRSFLRTAMRLTIAWIVIVGGLWLSLRWYTQPGNARNVPNLEGMTIQEAQLMLDSIGLIAVHLDSVYTAEGRPFEIIDQVPPSETSVKKGRKVYLTSYRATPPLELLGIDEGQDPAVARIILENKGFNVKEKSEPNLALEGRVIRVEDAKGNILSLNDRLPKGSTVRLIYGTKSKKRVGVPNVKGQTLTEARITLTKAELSIGLVQYVDSVKNAADTLAARVLEQHLRPRIEKNVLAGTEVDLVLGPWIKDDGDESDSDGEERQSVEQIEIEQR